MVPLLKDPITFLIFGKGSDLLLPHFREVLLELILRLLAVVGRGACALCEEIFVL
jgi:hypothetical protein